MTNILKLLQGLARHVKVSSKDITILNSPSQFKNTLLELSEGVQKKTIISTLYIGNGPSETKIISHLSSAADRGCDVNIVMDRYRGFRDYGLVLKPLQRKAKIHLFRTPHFKTNILPGQVYESFGVHHIKFYLFDDTVILSGANMSELYFGPRQDRYIVVKSQPLSQFLESWYDLYSNICLLWEPMSKPKDGFGAPVWNPSSAIQAANDTHYYMSPFPRIKCNGDHDTSIFMLFQMWWNQVWQADDAIATVLMNNKDHPVTLSSSYFNPTDKLTEVLRNAQYPVDIIIPSYKANGFYGATGIKGTVPYAYNNAADLFLKKCPNVTLHQYDRNNWSFHGKGVWLDNLNIIGSSNFSKRSCKRDSELLFAFVTDCSDLKDRFMLEKENLMYHSSPFTKEYHFMIPPMKKIISSFL